MHDHGVLGGASPERVEEAARVAAVEAASSDWPMPVAIRVNGVGTEWHSLDLDAASRAGCAFAILPGATSQHLLREVREVLGKPVLAMIETAAGVEGAKMSLTCNRVSSATSAGKRSASSSADRRSRM